MPKYHAVMLDETGCEFGVDLEAADRDCAYDALRNGYEESRCVQLEDEDDTREREARMYRSIEREMYGDDLDEEPDFDD